MIVPKALNTQSLQGKPQKNENSKAELVQTFTPAICLCVCVHVPKEYSSAPTKQRIT